MHDNPSPHNIWAHIWFLIMIIILINYISLKKIVLCNMSIDLNHVYLANSATKHCSINVSMINYNDSNGTPSQYYLTHAMKIPSDTYITEFIWYMSRLLYCRTFIQKHISSKLYYVLCT